MYGKSSQQKNLETYKENILLVRHVNVKTFYVDVLRD